MKNRKNIQEELGNLGSQLPDASNPYAVPEGYFDNFAAGMLAKVKEGAPLSAAEELASISPLLASIPRTATYTVPEGYFNDTIESLAAFTAPEKSALLSLIEKEGPYTVPVGYFAGFAESVLQKRGGGRVVQMKRRGWARMAVAAAVTGIMAIGGYFYTQQDREMKPVAVQLKNVSTQEIEAFIRSTGATISNTETAQSGPIVKPEVEEMLDDVSDRELDAFLSAMPYEEELTSYN